MVLHGVSDTLGHPEETNWQCEIPRKWTLQCLHGLLGSEGDEGPSFASFGRYSQDVSFSEQIHACRQKVAACGGIMRFEVWEGSIATTAEKLDTLFDVLRRCAGSTTLVVHSNQALARTSAQRAQVYALAKELGVAIFVSPHSTKRRKGNHPRLELLRAHQAGQPTLYHANARRRLNPQTSYLANLRSIDRHRRHHDRIHALFDQGLCPAEVKARLKVRISVRALEAMLEEGRSTRQSDAEALANVSDEEWYARAQAIALAQVRQRRERLVRLGRYLVTGGDEGRATLGSHNPQAVTRDLAEARDLYDEWCRIVGRRLYTKSKLERRKARGNYDGKMRIRLEAMLTGGHTLRELTEFDYQHILYLAPRRHRADITANLARLTETHNTTLSFIERPPPITILELLSAPAIAASSC